MDTNIISLFKRYQKYLLQFTNTDHGKAFLADKWGGKIEKSDKVIKVTPDGFHLLKDFVNNKPIIQATFFPKSPYIGKFAETLTYLSIMEENKMIDKVRNIKDLGKYIYLTVFNPDASTGATTVDGRIFCIDTNWANTHDNATGDTAAASDTNEVCCASGRLNLTERIIQRGFYLFDTSSLTAQATITDAVFSVYVTALNDDDNDANDFVSVVKSTPAASNNLVTADYDQIGTEEQHATGQRKDLSSISTTQYLDITFDTTGKDGISKTSISKYALREGHDLLNDDYGGANDSNNRVYANYADNDTNKPKLTVTYSLPSVGSLFLAGL